MLCQSVICHIRKGVHVTKEDGAALRRFDVNVGILKVGESTLVRDGAGREKNERVHS